MLARIRARSNASAGRPTRPIDRIVHISSRTRSKHSIHACLRVRMGMQSNETTHPPYPRERRFGADEFPHSMNAACRTFHLNGRKLIKFSASTTMMRARARERYYGGNIRER